jgi:D-aminopeptidase
MQHSYVLPIGFGSMLLGEYNMPLICHDGDPYLERESRLRSGEYFETVATELENISHQVDDATQKALQEIIDEFVYAQQYYKIVKSTNDT